MSLGPGTAKGDEKHVKTKRSTETHKQTDMSQRIAKQSKLRNKQNWTWERHRGRAPEEVGMPQRTRTTKPQRKPPEEQLNAIGNM